VIAELVRALSAARADGRRPGRFELSKEARDLVLTYAPVGQPRVSGPDQLLGLPLDGADIPGVWALLADDGTPLTVGFIPR